MFEATQSRSAPVLGLVVLVLLGGAGWLGWRQLHPAAPSEPVVDVPVVQSAEPSGSLVVGATPREVRDALNATLKEHPGGRLFHLDCSPPGCIATLRIPYPRGADAGWRNAVEASLKEGGWFLRPAGRVERFEPKQTGEALIPERVMWSFGMRRRPEPVPPDEQTALKARIDRQMKETVLRMDPW